MHLIIYLQTKYIRISVINEVSTLRIVVNNLVGGMWKRWKKIYVEY